MQWIWLISVLWGGMWVCDTLSTCVYITGLCMYVISTTWALAPSYVYTYMHAYAYLLYDKFIVVKVQSLTCIVYVQF